MTKPSLACVPSLDEIIDEGIMPSNDFKVDFDSINIGDFEEDDVRLVFCYDRHGQIDVVHKSKGGMKIALTALDSQIFASSALLSEKVEMLGLGTEVSGEDLFSLKMIPTKSPFMLKLNDNARKVYAHLINGPDLHPGKNVSIYTYKEFEISVRTLETTRKLRKNIKVHKYDYVTSHELTLKSLNKEVISAEKALFELSRFRNFLTFVRGGYCGLGHIQGISDDESQSYNYLGFNKSDRFKMEIGWFNIGITRYLPDLYTLYRKAVEDNENTYVILRSIEFYRASNTISESTKEVALVSSYAALETLVPHVLSTKAGWSKDLINSKSKFVDQLRAASAFLGLSADLFEHSPELRKKLLGMNNLDEFDLLGVFRNRIVHQGRVFKYSGIELHEIWCFAQWLVEIFIFAMIGYRKEMNDRRKYKGWSGGSVNVPIDLKFDLSS